jgi:hypothetical protein
MAAKEGQGRVFFIWGGGGGGGVTPPENQLSENDEFVGKSEGNFWKKIFCVIKYCACVMLL